MHAGQQQFKRYRRETMLSAYEDYLAHLETLGIALTEQQRLAHFRGWFASHIRRGWRQLSRAAQVINPVKCREDISPPAPRANNAYDQALPEHECGLAHACGLDRYLSAHRSDLTRVAHGLGGLEEPDLETQRRTEALKRLVAKPAGSNFVGQDCWSSGDVIICHETPVDAVLISKNRKHFEPLCQILQRTLHSYM